ncbi:MAG TPA: hypothetical protein VFS68_11335 [Candidatus Udaeobacter sp.]|nr:hypothetical protein [Candidatus Udaeobacter sp.]
MKIRFCLIAAAGFALTGPLGAGTLELQPKESAPPTITQSQPWQFTIASPGWMASMNGTIGIRGVNADLDVGFFDDILEHLDMIFAMRAEAQKGPFGIFGEIIYLGLSDGAQINGLINNIHEQVDMTLVDGALSWRLVNEPRWSLDFAAGMHYNNVYEKLELHSDPTLIQQTSQQFVTNISDDLVARLNNDISNSDFVARLENDIEADISSKIGKHGSLDGRQRKPRIPIGPLGGRIEEDVARVVQDFVRAKETALRTRIDALRLKGAARRAAVRRIVSATETRIANQLAVTLNTKLDQTLSRDDFWFDPYVGLRTRYNFSKAFYTAVRGEIGGFGVGADLMWEVEGVIGINMTRSIFTEVGYRALSSDFEDNNFRFDTVMHGPQITTGITF